jgi:wee1-like protein kinase
LIIRSFLEPGDFGRAAPLSSTSIDEGDVRYVSLEALQGLTSDLTKVDVFALGITLYELATGEQLPKTGDEWQVLRCDGVPAVAELSNGFNALLQVRHFLNVEHKDSILIFLP